MRLLAAITVAALVLLWGTRAAWRAAHRTWLRLAHRQHFGRWTHTGPECFGPWPEGQCIYVHWSRKRWWVFGRRRCLYTGRATDLRRRFLEHWRDGKPQRERWDAWEAVEVPDGARRAKEQRAIDAFRPKHNARNEIARRRA